MYPLRQELLNVSRALTNAGVPYALCGGLAVALHGYPRATRDIDLVIRSEDLKQAMDAVGSLGFTLPAAPMVFRKGKPEEQRIERISRIEGEEVITIDFVLAGPFLEDVWADREVFDLDGESIVAVSRDGLIKMKRSADRAQDVADIQQLESHADDVDNTYD
jgi:hypothetical protein